MPRKCCIAVCETNYEPKKGDKKVKPKPPKEKPPVFRFRKDKDGIYDERWVKAIPNKDFVPTEHKGVCALHWPPGFETIRIGGHDVPKYPPSVWPHIPSSQVPTPPPPPRPTSRASSSVRTREEDQLSDFSAMDSVTFSQLKDKLFAPKKDLPAPVITFLDDEDNCLVVQSQKFVKGVPLFVLRVSNDQTFENFHMGVRCTINTLARNRITTLKSWSAVQECIRFLNTLEIDHKKQIIQEQLQAMGTQQVGKALYTPDMIMRAFQYFAKSRSTYYRIREDFQLPSVQTLTRITSKVAKMDEASFGRAVFQSLQDRQRQCILLQDEVS